MITDRNKLNFMTCSSAEIFIPFLMFHMYDYKHPAITVFTNTTNTEIVPKVNRDVEMGAGLFIHGKIFL